MEHIPYSLIERINIIKMSILPKTLYKFNAIPMKIPMTYFTDIKQTFKKIIWNHKQFQIASTILKKKEQNKRHHHTWHKSILQSHSNQNSLLLVQG